MKLIKDISELLVSISKIVGITISVVAFLLKIYDSYMESYIETKNAKIVERIIVLEEFDRARYLSLVDNVYSLIKSGHMVTQSELEFILKFRNKFMIDNEVTDKKLEYISKHYLEIIK